MLMALPSNPVAAVHNLSGIMANTCGTLPMGNPHCLNWYCTRGMDIILHSAHACGSNVTMQSIHILICLLYLAG
jgi:hypothetical protein